MKDIFNPYDWLDENEDDDKKSSNPQPSNHPTIQPSNHQPSSTADDIERVVSRIEATHTDMTGSYADWRNLGFALADELGEGGRNYFHRISRFYPKYSHTDCDKQYDHCVKAKGHGITIKTLFHMAKQAGIEIGRTGNGDGRQEDGDGRQEDGNGRREKEEGNMGRWEDEKMGTWEGETPPSLPVSPSHFPTLSPSADSGLPPADSVLPSPEPLELPTLPDSIFPTLPGFLQRVVEVADSTDERDILLLGTLGCLSACFPKISGIYDGKKVFANIYLFITAQASAGKGRLGFCKQLVEPIHWEARNESYKLQQAFEVAMREYNLVKMKDHNAEKPEKPPEKMLFIPANSSATGVFQLLADNQDRGLIFETEGDTLALAFKSDHGNYSDGFRKGAHHERISYYRRTDREYREIKFPCISTVLSGTPKQVSTLIPNAENGLFSRFIFYHMNIRPVWKNVFSKRYPKGLDEYFDRLGQEFFSLYKALRQNPEMEFCLTPEQEDQFHEFFTLIQDKYLTFYGMDYMGTIRRLGLIAFRLAMIFTGLRMMETGDFSDKQVCSDTDFQNSLSMVRILIKHSSHVFSQLPEEIKLSKAKDRKEQFLDKLPEKFNAKEFLDLAKRMSILERTAQRYIALFCEKGWICKDYKDSYIKVPSPGKITLPGEPS